LAERWLSALEQDLLGRLLHKTEEDPPPSPNHLTGVDASLLSSSWQKAIRRGHDDIAARCVATLHASDPAYVWRRLRGIALEEVSAADLELVAQLIAIAGKQVLRAKLGDLRLALQFTQRLARASKCRTACDFLMWQDPPQTVDWIGIHARLDEGQPWTLVDVAAQARAWQAITARSTYREGRWVQLSQADPARRDALLDAAGVPDVVRYLVLRGNSTDTLNALLVPTYLLAQQQADRVDESDQYPASNAPIGPLPAYAYCLFSAPGRAALRTLLRTSPALTRLIRSVPGIDALRAVGHVVFQLEGGFCHHTYRVAHALDIRAAYECATLERYGVPADRQPELRALVQAAWPQLQRARQHAAALMRGPSLLRESISLPYLTHRSHRP
jgi:hypothetical protein